MKNYMLVSLVSKQYNKNQLLGFILDIFSYDRNKMECSVKRVEIEKQEFYKYVQSNSIIPINFTISSTKLTQIKFENLKEMVEHIAKAVRNYMEVSYGTGTDLAGHCIEASEYIEKIVKYFGYKDIKSVEGWCLFDSEDYGSDRPYDEHTWIELNQGKIYVDVTADQFNPGMYMENQFEPIIINKGLPEGMRYEEPEEGVDYWLDE